MTQCSRCGEISSWMKTKSRCMKCHKAVTRERSRKRYATPEAKLWHSEYNKKTYDPAKQRVANWKTHLRQYGLTPARYEVIKSQANGKCQCCGTACDNLVVDHCHIGGNVRGLICYQCNIGLGMFKADLGVRGLQCAIVYIEKNIDLRL